MREVRVLLVALAALCAGALLAACGGGTRQDAAEPSASFAMKVLRASFPAAQAVARPAVLELEVQNASAHALPNVAVSLDSLDYLASYPHLADRRRPVWAIERGPGAIAHPPVESEEVSIAGGAQTAYVQTWALGGLAPRQTQTFVWHLMPVYPGMHTVHYRLAAGLTGKAKAVPAGGPVEGAFKVDIAGKPPAVHVNPQTGKVESGPYVPSS